jgi:hypothetical protein
MKERWKPVVGWSHYQVSNLGRVRSERKILKPQVNCRCGYRFVQLCPGRVNRYVGQLVLEAFKGPRPTGLEVDHLDRIKTNDKLSNLKWVTHSQNNLNTRRQNK